MARLVQIVVDAVNPVTLARFWAATLEEFEARPYDDDEVARLAALGHTPATDPMVILDSAHLELCFQRVDDDPPRAKRRLHFDITTTDRSTEVALLQILGGTVAAHFNRHTWMRDPEGNDFCVVEAEA